MLGKLLKYDLKGILKFLSIFYVITLFFSGLTHFFINIESPYIAFLIGRILSGTLISFFISTLINQLMALWIKLFATGVYKDKSYLTHTLPIRKADIYLSKLLTSIIVSAISVTVIVVTAFIAYYSEERWKLVKQFLTGEIGKTITILVIFLFLELINLIQCGYTGIILGHKCNSGKTGLSVLFSFLAYTVSQIIVLLFTAAAALISVDFKALFVSRQVQIPNSVLLTIAAVYLVIIIVNAIINIKLLEKGVDIE